MRVTQRRTDGYAGCFLTGALGPALLRKYRRSSGGGVVLAAALGLQNFRRFVDGGDGYVPFEVAGNGERGVAHANLGCAVRAAGRGEDLLAKGIGHRYSMKNAPSNIGGCE